jgi:hypothetical protein
MFIVLLLFLSGLAPALADEVLIPAGATWKYLDNGSNQGTVPGTQGRFVHASPATGWNYYRLRGGSDVREQKLFVRGDLRLRLAPNPARSQVAVHLENVRNGWFRVPGLFRAEHVHQNPQWVYYTAK